MEKTYSSILGGGNLSRRDGAKVVNTGQSGASMRAALRSGTQPGLPTF